MAEKQKKKAPQKEVQDTAFAARQERFAAMCEAERHSDRPAEGTGIGTYKEKRLHALLKDFYTPERARQEVRLEEDMLNSAYADLTDAATRRARDRYVADILTDEGEIIEIQTGGLYPLTKKLHFYLCATKLRVTVVHPICAIKHMRWMDPETGELSPLRRSPKRGKARDVARELYWLLPYLAEPRFRLVLPLIEVEEIRLQNGWGREGKRGSERYDRFAMSLCDEVVLSSPSDYATLFLPPPEALPAPFTAAEYAKATGIRGMATYTALRMLTELRYLAPAAPRGRAGTWERI
ncbi:MAG: hypothetical protein E7625_05440 [Ruminococcaceae bacterium]|nr:hypothetical protein [Oscillospiraceae bacterium]